MKKNLLILSVAANFLAMSALADDVVLRCQKHTGDTLASLVTFTYLKNNENDSYSIVQKSSGYNLETRRDTETIEILDPTCSWVKDLILECSTGQYILSLDTQDTYSLRYETSYQEPRTGIWRHVNKMLSVELTCTR